MHTADEFLQSYFDPQAQEKVRAFGPYRLHNEWLTVKGAFVRGMHRQSMNEKVPPRKRFRHLQINCFGGA